MVSEARYNRSHVQERKFVEKGIYRHDVERAVWVWLWLGRTLIGTIRVSKSGLCCVCLEGEMMVQLTEKTLDLNHTNWKQLLWQFPINPSIQTTLHLLCWRFY